MLLTLDVGNSAVKAGLFEDESLVRVESIDPPDAEAVEQRATYWRDTLAPFFDDATIDRIGHVSVVPARTEAVMSALRPFTSAPVTAVRPDMDLPFTLDYDTPDTLGNDRLAAAAAGWIQYGRDAPRSVLVVDAGTAVNYEVVHRDGIYRGGAIDAGPALVQQALRAGTAQLPDVSLTFPKASVGASTQTALQSGIMWGLIESVRGMRTRLTQPLPDVPELVITGGWSDVLTDRLNKAHHAPHLVLRGVRLLTIRNG